MQNCYFRNSSRWTWFEIRWGWWRAEGPIPTLQSQGKSTWRLGEWNFPVILGKLTCVCWANVKSIHSYDFNAFFLLKHIWIFQEIEIPTSLDYGDDETESSDDEIQYCDCIAVALQKSLPGVPGKKGKCYNHTLQRFRTARLTAWNAKLCIFSRNEKKGCVPFSNSLSKISTISFYAINCAVRKRCNVWL